MREQRYHVEKEIRYPPFRSEHTLFLWDLSWEYKDLPVSPSGVMCCGEDVVHIAADILGPGKKS